MNVAGYPRPPGSFSQPMRLWTAIQKSFTKVCQRSPMIHSATVRRLVIYIIEIHQSVDHLSSREDYTVYLKIIVRSSIWLLSSSKFLVILKVLLYHSNTSFSFCVSSNFSPSYKCLVNFLKKFQASCIAVIPIELNILHLKSQLYHQKENI